MNALLIKTNSSESQHSSLEEISRVMGGRIDGRNVIVQNTQGKDVLLPSEFIEHFPTIEQLKNKVTLFNEEPTRASRVSIGCKAASVALYGAHYTLQATSSLAPLVGQLFAAKVVGYPLSDGMAGYASHEQLKVLREVKDLEGVQIQKDKITESSFSFLGGVLLSGAEVSTALGATALSAILSFAMLPLYALGFVVSCKVQGKQISLSKQLKQDLASIVSLKNPSEEGLKKGLEHMKSLLTPSEKALKDIVEELGKENQNKELIQEKLTEYKNEQFKKFQELERKIGSSAANELIDNLDHVLAELKNGNLEAAENLLATIEKGASIEIIKAAIAIVIGLIVLAAFVAMTVVTHGAALSLLL